jgi:hypothetical protein
MEGAEEGAALRDVEYLTASVHTSIARCSTGAVALDVEDAMPQHARAVVPVR